MDGSLGLGIRHPHTEFGTICVRRMSPVRIMRQRERVDSFTSWARKEEREKVREAFYYYYFILFSLMLLLEFCELASVGSCVPTITIKTRNSSSPNMSVCSHPSSHILAAMDVSFVTTVCPLQNCHTDGIIEYVVLGVLFLSLSTMHLGFFHASICIGTIAYLFSTLFLSIPE